MLLSPIEINNLKFTKYFVLCFKESRKIKTPTLQKIDISTHRPRVLMMI